MTHTPGPWRVKERREFKDWVILADVNSFSARAHSAEDARLIAAAPALLEALKEVADLCERRGGGCPNCFMGVKKARAAIALCEGGEKSQSGPLGSGDSGRKRIPPPLATGEDK
jgi:hypothetical protein